MFLFHPIITNNFGDPMEFPIRIETINPKGQITGVTYCLSWVLNINEQAIYIRNLNYLEGMKISAAAFPECTKIQIQDDKQVKHIFINKKQPGPDMEIMIWFPIPHIS